MRFISSGRVEMLALLPLSLFVVGLVSQGGASVPFTDPIVAGNKLVRPAIMSPDYVAGTSGWTIKRDGSAEFNNVTVRGELDITGADGSRIQGVTGAQATVQFTPPSVPGITWNVGVLQTLLGGDVPYTYLHAAREVGNAGASLSLFGSNASNPNSWIAGLTASDFQIDVTENVTVNSYPVHLQVGEVVDTSNSSSFTGVETQTDSITFAAESGRRYKIEWSGGFISTVNGDQIQYGLREDNSTGTRLGVSRDIISATVPTRFNYTYYWTAPSTSNKTIVLTAIRTGGTGTITRSGSATQTSTLNVVQVS